MHALEHNATPPVITFDVLNWSAWATGFESVAAWREWDGADLTARSVSKGPKLAFVDAMLRRRCSRLTRMALHSAHDCLEQRSNISSVFCSPHGEIHRTKTLLDDIVDAQPVSPMGFSLSVHNTASGLHSISSANRAATTAIAAGADTFAIGVIEAVARSKQSAAPVLVVYADEPLPEFYRPYATEPVAPHALALLLTHRNTAGWSLAIDTDNARADVGYTPSLEFLRLLLGKKLSGDTGVEAADSGFNCSGEQFGWQWRKPSHTAV